MKYGKLNITCEDCMDLMKRYEDNHFELAIVDPPYGIGMGGGFQIKTVKNRPNWEGGKKYKNKKWDNEAPNVEYFKELKRVSKNQIIWGANHFIEGIPNANSSCWVVWDKRNGENTFADGELAYTSFKTAIKKFTISSKVETRGGKDKIHPTQKPVALYKWLLKNYAKDGDKILDTHMGSGSIAIACYYMGLDLTACELDEEYFTQAMERIKHQTRQQTLC